MRKFVLLIALVVVLVLATSVVAMAAPAAPTGANSNPLGWWRANHMGLDGYDSLGDYMHTNWAGAGGYGPALTDWMYANGFK